MKINLDAKETLYNFVYSIIAIIFSFIIAAVIMFCVGYNPISAYVAMFDGAFGSVNSLANTLSKSIPLIFTGLAFAFANKGGLFNIGGEGQIYIGAISATALSLAIPNAPRIIILPLSFLAGMLAGGTLGGCIGAIKAKLKINEVIVAIMFNYIAQLFSSYCVNGPMKAVNSMTPQSEFVPKAVLLSPIIERSQLTSALFVAFAVVVIQYFFFKKTRIGYNIRAVGENDNAAKASGVGMVGTTVLTMGISGAIASLAGVTEVLGKYGRFIDGFSPGFGFTGIAVAVLGKNNPFGIIITAILFGAMEAGALKMSYIAGISANMVMVIQGLVILFVATPQIVKSLNAIVKGVKK